MPTIPAAVFLPSLYSTELGLAAAGTALLIARASDVVTDPLVGALSDRWRPAWGRRKPWIAAGAVIAGLALVKLFQPPAEVTFAYVLGWSIMLYLGWTLVSVPYSAWGAELSTGYQERAKITSAREGATVLGIFAAGTVPIIAAANGQSERDALAIISWLAVIVGLPAILFLLGRVPDPLPPVAADQPAAALDLRRSVQAMAQNKPFVRLLGAWLINGLANGIPSTLFLLYLEHRLQADQGERGILILVYFLFAVATIPAWLWVSGRIGKHRTWCAAMIATCLAFAWVPALAPGDIFAFGLICAVTGMGLGADLSLPPALQADVIDFDTLKTGANRAGLFFALWGMATKLSLALAVGITFPVLDYFGFDPTGHSTAEGLVALAVIYAAVPVVLKVGAIGLVWNFPITAERQNMIRRRIDALAERRMRRAERPHQMETI